MQAWWAEETSLKQYLKILRFKFFDWYCIVLYIYIYIYIYIWYTIPVSVCVGVCGLVVGRARLPGPKNARDDFFLSQPWLVIPGNDWWSFCLNKLLIPTGGLINMRTVALTWDVRIERMNEGCIYIALYCVLLYTQSTLQSCVCVCVCVWGGGGVFPQPPPVCSIHLDDVTAATGQTAPVCSPHTSYRWRGERVIEPIKWMGIIRTPWLTRASGGNLATTPGLHPFPLREVPWDF